MLTVSAVIPLYNGQQYINDAIGSALAQDYPVDEIIVVDDGSTDNGAFVVRDLIAKHPKIKLITQPNQGQASARNAGASASKGELIAFLDQDDLWYSTHVRLLVQPFEGETDIGWSYSNIDEVDVNGEMVRNGLLDFHPNEHPKRSLHSCLAQDMHIFPTATIVSKKAFIEVGGFDERFVGYEDDDLFLRIFRAGFRNSYTSKPLASWRMHSSSTSFGAVMARSRQRYFEKLFRTYQDDAAMMRYYVRDLIAPRFTKSATDDLKLAIHRKDRTGQLAALSQISAFSEFLAPRQRIKIRLGLWLLSYGAGRAAYRMAPSFIVRRFHAITSM